MPQAVLSCSSPLATITSFTACVVGRRFQPKADTFDGETVAICHEAGNVRDRNALLVVGSNGQVPSMRHAPELRDTAQISTKQNCSTGQLRDYSGLGLIARDCNWKQQHEIAVGTAMPIKYLVCEMQPHWSI